MHNDLLIWSFKLGRSSAKLATLVTQITGDESGILSEPLHYDMIAREANEIFVLAKTIEIYLKLSEIPCLHTVREDDPY